LGRLSLLHKEKKDEERVKKCENVNIQSEPVLLNVYGAPELILRNEFHQPM
jgi:hypothetical protein